MVVRLGIYNYSLLKMNYIKDTLLKNKQLVNQLLSDENLHAKISQTTKSCIEALNNGKKIIFAGNGGSAADSQHLAAELISKFEFEREAISSISLTTDTSIITSISNDFDYSNIFSRQIEGIGLEGDIFFGISTSGNSQNIINAFITAKSKGIICVGLTGNNNKLNLYCDHLIQIPSENTARIQEGHRLIGHILCGFIENEFVSRKT